MGNTRFTREFKISIVQALESGRTTNELAREHGITQSLIRGWKRQYKKDPLHAFSGQGNPSSTDARNAELERKIGQLYLENEFIKKVNTNLQARLAELKKNSR